MPFLLDTNAWIHYLKHANSPIRGRLAALQPSAVLTCSVVRSELLHGANKYAQHQKRVAAVENALSPFRSLPFDDAAAAIYASVRHRLEAVGKVIGPYDLQIAAICMLHGLTLVTSNIDEFSRIEGLAIENWLVSTSAS